MTIMSMETAGAAGPVERIQQIYAWLGRLPESILALAFRLGVGVVFFKSGLTKIASWKITVGLFRDECRVPLLPLELAATMAAVGELTAPVLLAHVLSRGPGTLSIDHLIGRALKGRAASWLLPRRIDQL